jgi:hypothetical protein
LNDFRVDFHSQSKYNLNINGEFSMKDILSDIVAHTQNLGFLTTVKITGAEDKTEMFSMADDKSVIMTAETANPYPDMIGVFGMPQLNKLKYLLDGSEYKEDAKITIVSAERNSETVPVGIHFENKDGDFKNDYKFMLSEVITEKMKTVKFRGVKWDVEIEPSVASVQRFNFQAGANPEHPTFLAKTDGGHLKFIFGDASTHGGEFVFAHDVVGKLDRGWTWPVNPILSILKIADVNNTKMSLSNEGAIQITLDSGLAVYKYIIPAQAV